MLHDVLTLYVKDVFPSTDLGGINRFEYLNFTENPPHVPVIFNIHPRYIPKRFALLANISRN